MQPFRIRTLYLFIFLIAGQNLLGQSYLPYSAGQNDKKENLTIYRNYELTLGYAPKKGEERIKTTIGLNNFLFKRIGAYTSFEYAFADTDFYNITGGNITLNKMVYIWGGIDLFSKNGLIRNGYQSP